MDNPGQMRLGTLSGKCWGGRPSGSNLSTQTPTGGASASSTTKTGTDGTPSTSEWSARGTSTPTPDSEEQNWESSKRRPMPGRDAGVYGGTAPGAGRDPGNTGRGAPSGEETVEDAFRYWQPCCLHSSSLQQSYSFNCLKFQMKYIPLSAPRPGKSKIDPEGTPMPKSPVDPPGIEEHPGDPETEGTFRIQHPQGPGTLAQLAVPGGQRGSPAP